jgi:hypothetical protein
MQVFLFALSSNCVMPVGSGLSGRSSLAAANRRDRRDAEHVQNPGLPLRSLQWPRCITRSAATGAPIAKERGGREERVGRAQGRGVGAQMHS